MWIDDVDVDVDDDDVDDDDDDDDDVVLLWKVGVMGDMFVVLRVKDWVETSTKNRENFMMWCPFCLVWTSRLGV